MSTYDEKQRDLNLKAAQERQQGAPIKRRPISKPKSQADRLLGYRHNNSDERAKESRELQAIDDTYLAE